MQATTTTPVVKIERTNDHHIAQMTDHTTISHPGSPPPTGGLVGGGGVPIARGHPAYDPGRGGPMRYGPPRSWVEPRIPAR